MSMTIKIAVLALAVCVVPAVLSEKDGADLSSETIAQIQKQVLEVHDKMIRSASELDVDGMFEPILDGPYGPVIRDGKLMLSREVARKGTQAAFRGVDQLKYTFTRLFVKVLSADMALLTGDGETEMKLLDGRSFSSPFALSELFVLKDGKWKVLHAHQSVPNPQG